MIPMGGLRDIMVINMDKKIKEKFSDKYFLVLAIYQHLIECQQKFEAYKNHSLYEYNKEYLEKEMDKELADLFILLEMYVSEDLYNQRIQRFLEHIN